MRRSGLVRLLAAGFALAAAVPSLAVPTVRGATGFIFIPNANLAASTSAFYQGDKVATSGTRSFSAVEGGILNRDGRNFYDFKLQLLPDITTDDEWVPGVAIGLRGLSSRNDFREYYALVQKHFRFPECTIVWGMSKAISWKHGSKKAFYGIEVPLFAGISVLADHDGQRDVTNAGVRFVFKKHFCFYDYVEDVRRRGGDPATRRNLVGACYQSQF
jgi:hypothetical protein